MNRYTMNSSCVNISLYSLKQNNKKITLHIILAYVHRIKIFLITSYSGFPSERINLSPFTKDFRGGEQLNESEIICLWLASVSLK